MNSPHDDSRLTAYALGELEEFERTEVEALIADDPEALALVAEIQATARLLADNLQAEAVPGLAPEQRQAIETRLETTPKAEMSLPAKPRQTWGRWVMAAGVIGLAGTLLYPAYFAAHRRNTESFLALGDAEAITSDVHARSGQLAVAPEAKGIPPQNVPFRSRPFSEIVEAELTEVPSSSLPIARLQQATGGEKYADGQKDSKPPGQSGNQGQSQTGKQSQEAAGYAVNSKLDNSLGRKAPVYTQASPRPNDQKADAKKSEPAVQGQSDQATYLGMKGDSHDGGNTKSPKGEQPGAANGKGTNGMGGGMGSMGGQDQNNSGQAAQAPAKVGQAAQAPAKVGLPFTQGSAASTQPFNANRQAPKMQMKGRAEGFVDEMQAVDRAMVVADGEGNRGVSQTRDFKELAERRRAFDADRGQGGDAFTRIVDNPFVPVEENPLSTFSIDVDTASYANVRRYINQNTRPPADAVRIEELLNYFPYSYPKPKGDDPFSVNLEVARCPWDSSHRLVRIGLKGREIDNAKRPVSNLVFLVDVSGSMNVPDKLPLLKAGMKLLIDQLGENDRVAIVVYAAAEGLALSSTSCSQKEKILSALEELQAGGSTNGGRGIQLAYDIAVQNFIQGGTNRVILATDGDFNVGVTEGADLDRLIVQKRETGVALSVLGFGQGNVKHDKLESLADKGNGQYSYIDTIKEARKVLIEQISGTLVTIAKDVKIQVKFNPAKAASYRLIGYENRVLQAQDFANDKKDAGEIGAGHCVTALYEVVPPRGQGGDLAKEDQPLNQELLNVDLRYKAPNGDVSKLITFAATDQGHDFAAASDDYKFAASVAGFGMLLRNSPYKGSLTWTGLLEMTRGAIGPEPAPYRQEFLELIGKAQNLEPR